MVLIGLTPLNQVSFLCFRLQLITGQWQKVVDGDTVVIRRKFKTTFSFVFFFLYEVVYVRWSVGVSAWPSISLILFFNGKILQRVENRAGQ